MCINHLFKLKERKKKCRGDNSMSKNDLKPPFSMNEGERKLRENVEFLSLTIHG